MIYYRYVYTIITIENNMNNNIMATRKTLATTSETRRSIAAVQVSSRTHQINPVPASDLDSVSASEHPLWQAASILSIATDPTAPLTHDQIIKACGYLGKQIPQCTDPVAVEERYKAEMVVWRHMADRFLLLANANQSNPSVCCAFMEMSVNAREQFEACYELSKKWLKQVREDEANALEQRLKLRKIEAISM